MRKMAGVMATVAAVFLVSGCTPSHTVWLKRGVGVTMAQAVKDLKNCSDKAGFIFEASPQKGGPSAVSSEVSYETSGFANCMTAKGFQKK